MANNTKTPENKKDQKNKKRKPSRQKIKRPDVYQEQSYLVLAEWLGFTVYPKEIEASIILIRNGTAYRTFNANKKNPNSKPREINSPVKILKKIQSQFKAFIFDKMQVAPVTHGFHKKRSVLSSAKVHAFFGHKAALNLDLKDAFPSCVEQRLRDCIGWQIEKMLVKAFPRYFAMNKPLEPFDAESVKKEVIDLIFELIMVKGDYGYGLPQGSPCSPMLLNLACWTMDQALDKLLMQLNLEYRYTRYADDIVVSGKDNIPPQHRKAIITLIGSCGWKINHKKTKYEDPSRKVFGKKCHGIEVQGLIVGHDGTIRIPKDELERYRSVIHFHAWQKSVTALEHSKIVSTIQYIRSIYNGNLPGKVKGKWDLYCKHHRIKDNRKGEPKAVINFYNALEGLEKFEGFCAVYIGAIPGEKDSTVSRGAYVFQRTEKEEGWDKECFEIEDTNRPLELFYKLLLKISKKAEELKVSKLRIYFSGRRSFDQVLSYSAKCPHKEEHLFNAWRDVRFALIENNFIESITTHWIESHRNEAIKQLGKEGENNAS